MSWTYWYGHVVPTTLSPFVNDWICFATSPGQYSPTFGACFLSRSTAALNCSSFSWYGFLDPEIGLCRLQVHGRIGDEDRVVVDRDLALVLPELSSSQITAQLSGPPAARRCGT